MATGSLKKKILIVEDDPDYLYIVKTNLDNAGFSVVVAGSGEEGLMVQEKEKPDLILMDIQLPDPKMDGIETAKRIKAKNKSLPIIFLTNFSDIEHISKAMETTGSDYFVKTETHGDAIVARIKTKLGIK